MATSYYSSGLLSASRCSIEGFNQNNDVNPKTGKTGIRNHYFITAIFLALFGKIALYTNQDGKWVYLNKNSYNKWRKWRASQMHDLPTRDSCLPTPKAIAEALNESTSLLENRVLKKTKNESRHLSEKEAAAIIQATICQKMQRSLLEQIKLCQLKTKNKEMLGSKIIKQNQIIEELNQNSQSVDQAFTQQYFSISELQKQTTSNLEKLTKKKQGMKIELEGLGWNLKHIFSSANELLRLYF